MSNIAQWSALVGFLLPLLVSVVQQSHWSRQVRTIIGVISVVVASAVTAMVEHKLNAETWATSLIWVAMAAWTSYRNVWVPLGASPLIEKKTTFNNNP